VQPTLSELRDQKVFTLPKVHFLTIVVKIKGSKNKWMGHIDMVGVNMLALAELMCKQNTPQSKQYNMRSGGSKVELGRGETQKARQDQFFF